MNLELCKVCGKPVFWIEVKEGSMVNKLIAVDIVQVEAVFQGDTAPALLTQDGIYIKAPVPGTKGYIPHLYTCTALQYIRN